MKDYKIVTLSLLVTSFLIGMSIGETRKGEYFGPWYNDGRLRVGETVRFKDSAKYSELYNSCETMTVIGLQAVSDANQAWILMEKCSAFPNTPYSLVATDIVLQDCLVKSK
jgi:hypothetical protein